MSLCKMSYTHLLPFPLMSGWEETRNKEHLF